MSEDKQGIYSRLLEKIAHTEQVLQEWNSLKEIKGAEKLRRKIVAEMKFLKKLQSSTISLKEDHLLSSNLSHLQAIVQVATGAPPAFAKEVVAILEPFAYTSSDSDVKDETRLVVDLIAEDKKVWIKVIARNPRALHFLSTGQGQFGERTILDQAKDFLHCSRQHTYHFVPPVVKFVFQAGLTHHLATRLRTIGVEVVGEQVDDKIAESFPDVFHPESDSDDSSSTGDAEDDSEIEQIQDQLQQIDAHSSLQLNLDITALFAYVSALTNGHCDLVFKEPILTQQAEWERRRPVKPELDRIFEGKELICCQTAMDDFKTILGILGGEGERERSDELFKRITVVPDAPSERSMTLRVKGRIKERSKIIFGTGDTLKVVTVTANSGFVRSAQSQGVDFAVLLHESRALTEDKQQRATPIQAAEP